MFGTIKDWFGKHSEKLDTAASNLHFYVQEHHKHTGMCSHVTILIFSNSGILFCRLEAGVHGQHWAGVLAHEPGELHRHGAGPRLHQLDVRRR